MEDAVEQAITECIQEGILGDFLARNRADALEEKTEVIEELIKEMRQRADKPAVDF